ncbi:MAG: DUF4079 domain-containing protein [Oscillatoria sp. PMC 1051.18]|nr:DUF4079 domain-containing protein [Oscillatoria sp. PMC 1050.18]MEC5030372.1 DUF4079 domain-containing protein [Oscillatoria sp. PMC 1051.18]
MNFEIPESIKVWSQFLHPFLMWVLLAIALYSLYLGWQVRRIRTVEDKEVRKELVKKNYGQKHHQLGSALLAFMVIGAIAAMGVTYLNNEKLFFGSHLLTGLGMTALIATSASLVPFMLKGNEVARYTHITLNIVLLGLFGWQAITGMQIVFKIVSEM